jgi:hypothetical protein
MLDNTDIVDLIERASEARPTCPCGWHTTAVWREGAVWLECASLSTPERGLLRRFVSTLTGPTHVHVRIADVPPAGAQPVSA